MEGSDPVYEVQPVYKGARSNVLPERVVVPPDHAVVSLFDDAPQLQGIRGQHLEYHVRRKRVNCLLETCLRIVHYHLEASGEKRGTL